MISAMYLRKSRAEENEPVQETLRHHRDILTRYAADNDIIIAETYEEIVSGDSLYGRPEMIRLLEDLHKYESILCMDIDRLGRGAMREQGLIFESIRDSGALIITPAKTYNMADDMDDSLVSFKALFAREEYKMIRGRLRRGTLKAVEEGCYLSNAPFGYRQTRVNKKPTLEIDEHEAQAVKLIFESYIDGTGCQTIANHLHSLGYRPRRSDKFNRTTISKILKNPVYTGKVVWNQFSFKKPGSQWEKYTKRVKPRDEWLIVDGLHPPIIEQIVFEEANHRMEGRYHPPYRKPDQLENPLAGVLFCANCGRSMVRQPLYNKKYSSPLILCPTAGCCVSSNQDIAENILYSLLEGRLKDLKAAEPQKKGNVNQIDFTDGIMSEIARLTGQMGKLHDLLEQNVYDIDTFISRRDELTSRLEKTKATLLSVRKEPDHEEPLEKLESILVFYWDGSAFERNQLIKSVVSKAQYSKPKGSAYGTLPTLEITSWRS